MYVLANALVPYVGVGLYNSDALVALEAVYSRWPVFVTFILGAVAYGLAGFTTSNLELFTAIGTLRSGSMTYRFSPWDIRPLCVGLWIPVSLQRLEHAQC